MTRRPTPEEKEVQRLLEVAARQYRKALGSAIDLDELRSMGAPAAALALQRWDGRGHFGDFALQRIRWGILDGLRKVARAARLGDARDEVSALVAAERAADGADAAEKAEHEQGPPSVDSLLDDAVIAYEAELEAAELAGDGPEQIEDAAERLRLRREIEALPAVQRMVMERYVYGLETFEQIGAALGITRSSAFDAYNRALQRLRKRLNPDA